MESTSTSKFCIHRVQHFPPVINGRINIMEFLAAATDVVGIVESLGTVFAPVKIDMQGNIDKIKKIYKYDANSCLLELMLEEKAKGNPVAAEGVLWLNRALLFCELIFAELVISLKAQIAVHDVNMKKIFTTAYEGSVKKFHNWVTQQLFSLVCRMSPNLPQMLKSLNVDDVKDFEQRLENFNATLNLVRSEIDMFFKNNDLLDT